MEPLLIGVLENIDLPELGLHQINTRIDTGAQTSSLHVDHITEANDDGYIQFEFHPDSHDVERTILCTAKLLDKRWVKSSNGERQLRYVIKTLAKLGDASWEIELTLTDRRKMNHLMLLGREAMQGRVIIDPSQTYLATSTEP